MRRVYAYQESYDKLMEWGKYKMKTDIGFKPPNNKPNFSFFLAKMIEEVME